ncbi:MAG: hypothetical protein KGQ59_09395 [Bdellovibrionales bacterium]|nr:hypothetical protein [Bdellovibrionales bacterium]
MRTEFASWVQVRSQTDADLVFISGDLGFHSFEPLQENMGARFINAGVAEQNLVSVAAGLAKKNLRPICYSIAPFLVFRAHEQLRGDIGFHAMNVKIVGNGGGYGYGIMGPSHHAIDDLASMGALPNFRCFIPFSNEDVHQTCEVMMAHKGPAYLRLGLGQLPSQVPLPTFQPIRRVWTPHGQPRITVAALGPVGLQALAAIMNGNYSAELFVFSEFPINTLSTEFLTSVRDTHRLAIVEEHIAHGGLGSALALALLRAGAHPQIEHLHALGYPDGLYGSQSYHQTRSGLDEASIARVLERISRGVD